MKFCDTLFLLALAASSSLGSPCRPSYLPPPHGEGSTTASASFTSIAPSIAAATAKTTSTPSTTTPSVKPSASSIATAPSTGINSPIYYGMGTRYGDGCTEEDCWQNGACSFVGYDLPPGVDGSTCVSQDIWDNGGNCGGCISVTYKGKTITVMVTNLTGGNATHLDMTPDTWALLTDNLSAGGVPTIEWEWTACPIAQTLPLEIHMHGGASQYWFAATVQNARYRTVKLEVSSDGGNTWQDTARQMYNMWVLDGTLPSNTASVRVTSDTGSVVVVDNVALVSGQVTKATENYS